MCAVCVLVCVCGVRFGLCVCGRVRFGVCVWCTFWCMCVVCVLVYVCGVRFGVCVCDVSFELCVDDWMRPWTPDR